MTDLMKEARRVRENAHAKYSKFKVGAAIETVSGKMFTGCNVENAAYPAGTCAETGAIAAMVAAGEYEIAKVAVVADADQPIPPCGGCRQRLAEFSSAETTVTYSTLKGIARTDTMVDLLPNAFDASFLD